MINNNEKNKYYKIDYDSYLESFGVELKKGKYQIVDKEKLLAAYEKAWDNRDFEINKFWTRAAYFWGFLVLIFGAYFSSYEIQGEVNTYIPFYLICIGLVFSFAWTYVIKGSKRWQENWEGHINKLEDFISGPIYKTINNKNGRTFYSVSKINEILSYLIIVVWIGFLFEFILSSPIVKGNFKPSDLRLVVGIFISLVFIFTIVRGYGKSSVIPMDNISRRESS